MQLKILTTAGFSVIILDKHISAAKWRALFLLVLGCVLVASPAYNQPAECIADPGSEVVASGSDKSEGSAENADGQVSTMQTVLGFSAILAMNAISGFASIYFESMLKVGEKKITIWERNFQLAFCSIWLLVGVLMYEISTGVQELVFFQGWTVNTVLIALIQAGGGLLVAACLKYADSILKTLATSGSIVLSAVLGYLLLGGQLDIFIGIGCVCTILAITNYTFE
jgi:UDP-galactose transporter